MTTQSDKRPFQVRLETLGISEDDLIYACAKDDPQKWGVRAWADYIEVFKNFIYGSTPGGRVANAERVAILLKHLGCTLGYLFGVQEHTEQLDDVFSKPDFRKRLEVSLKLAGSSFECAGYSNERLFNELAVTAEVNYCKVKRITELMTNHIVGLRPAEEREKLREQLANDSSIYNLFHKMVKTNPQPEKGSPSWAKAELREGRPVAANELQGYWLDRRNAFTVDVFGIQRNLEETEAVLAKFTWVYR